MSSIAVITDTDASLPADVADQHGIHQVPIAVHFGEETLKTGQGIDDASLFEHVDREGELPTTSAPTPGDFFEAYQAAFERGADAIICLCVSSEVSATYEAARSASDLLPDRDITVVDSYSISMGQGFMALAAAEAIQEGLSKKEAIDRALATRERTHLYAALSTLKYLAMSGRVGHLTAGMANLLRIRPILTLQEGQLDLLERVRTQRKAWARTIDLTAAALDGRQIERMAVIHVAAENDARRFEKRLRARLPCPRRILTAELTPGLSVHTGAGLVGVAVMAKE